MTHSGSGNNKLALKVRFLNALQTGKLGTVNERGVAVTLKEFRVFFPDITSDYINSFLPATTLEPGRTQMTSTKFVFRLRRGVYSVHPDVLKSQAEDNHPLRSRLFISCKFQTII